MKQVVLLTAFIIGWLMVVIGLYYTLIPIKIEFFLRIYYFLMFLCGLTIFYILFKRR